VRRIHIVMLLAGMFIAPASFAGSIFVTGHDPIWHSSLGGNTAGATNLAQTGIEYARNGSSLPFLFVESTTVPIPAGNAHEAPFLTSSLSYLASDYDVMDAAALTSLADFRTTLNSYSAIVVASDHGGMLSGDELGFLNAHSADILDYLNAGGGLMASAESNATGMIGATPRFGFLPFLVSSVDFQTSEVSNTVTALGTSLGLTNADVNGNFSHNYFSATGGMSPVDLFNGDTEVPLSLAYRGQIGSAGVVPEPASFLLLGMGLAGFGLMRGRRRRATVRRA
jgi:hypothetical protein